MELQIIKDEIGVIICNNEAFFSLKKKAFFLTINQSQDLFKYQGHTENVNL